MQTIQSIKLKDITSKIGSGATPRGGKNSYITEGIALIRSLNVYDFSFAYEGLAFIDEKQASQLENVLVEGDDILLNITGASVCRCCLVPKNVLPARVNQHVSIVRIKPRAASARYVLYAINSPYNKRRLLAIAQGGATREALTKEKIENFEIPLPPLPTQLKIAAILSAYDDLIENNLRRIKILEEMAQTLYREWFVKFGLPGHQKVKIVESPLGKIPEEWEVKSLEFLIAEHIGGGWGNETPDRKHTEPAWVIRGTDIPDARRCNISTVPYRYHTLSNLRPRQLTAGDIIFEVSGGSKGQPLGRTLYISSELLSAFGGERVICASFCKRIRPDARLYSSEILYLSFLEAYDSGEIEQFQVQSTGISNFKWTEYIRQTHRGIPPHALQARFGELVNPLFSQIATLGLKNRNLYQTRDLLLPKLISGELDVSEMA